MPVNPAVALAAALWCALHSLFVSHWWRDLTARRAPGFAPWQRLVYVAASSLSLAALMLWIRGQPARPLWDWPGLWGAVRWSGLGGAAALFLAGARVFDGRFFLGLRQLADHRAGRPPLAPALHTGGILDHVRHPWYAGTLLLLVCLGPFDDVNLAWRGVFFLYTLLGAELEDRKLERDLGPGYADYRRRVPRFLPRPGRRP